MPRKESGYKGISLPVELVNEIENLIRENPQSGYRSISEFVQEAIRIRIQVKSTT